MGVVGRRLSLYCKRFFNPVAKLRAQITSLVKTIEEVPTIQSHSLIYMCPHANHTSIYMCCIYVWWY